MLEQRMNDYDLVVTFTPNDHLGYKAFNLYKVLENSQMFHPLLKDGLSLQHTAEAMFHDLNLFEHSRIIVEALTQDSFSYEQARKDLITENEVVKRVYQHFFKK